MHGYSDVPIENLKIISNVPVLSLHNRLTNKVFAVIERLRKTHSEHVRIVLIKDFYDIFKVMMLYDGDIDIKKVEYLFLQILASIQDDNFKSEIIESIQNISNADSCQLMRELAEIRRKNKKSVSNNTDDVQVFNSMIRGIQHRQAQSFDPMVAINVVKGLCTQILRNINV